jgi:hypothetical protein
MSHPNILKEKHNKSTEPKVSKYKGNTYLVVVVVVVVVFSAVRWRTLFVISLFLF